MMTEEKLQPETGGEEREPAVAATAPEGEAAEALEDDPVSLELQELQLELEELNRRYPIRLQPTLTTTASAPCASGGAERPG